MSLIVACKCTDGWVLGGDRYEGDGDLSMVSGVSKLQHRKDIAWGGVGYTAHIQAVEASLPKRNLDPAKFGKAVREARDGDTYAAFLGVYDGRVFAVDSQGGVSYPALFPYHAEGAGAAFALGYLWTDYLWTEADGSSEFHETSTVKRWVDGALQCAATFSVAVRPPYDFIHIGSDGASVLA